MNFNIRKVSRIIGIVGYVIASFATILVAASYYSSTKNGLNTEQPIVNYFVDMTGITESWRDGAVLVLALAIIFLFVGIFLTTRAMLIMWTTGSIIIASMITTVPYVDQGLFRVYVLAHALTLMLAWMGYEPSNGIWGLIQHGSPALGVAVLKKPDSDSPDQQASLTAYIPDSNTQQYVSPQPLPPHPVVKTDWSER